MPPNARNLGHRVWTVDDLHEGTGPGLAALAAAGDDNGGGGAPELLVGRCHLIPSLPRDDLAKLLLQRVVREFEPIIQRRNYNVRTVSELCCCGDGIDYHRRKGQRRRRIVASNVWGYNQWTSSVRGGQRTSSHTIHLRLRHPSDHSKFLLYEDVAGTMAHELAHCEHAPHNDQFYKLMDDILEEHAVLMASHLSRDGGYSMPAFAGTGRALGGGSSSEREARLRRLVPGRQPAGADAAAAAQGGGCRLGGDGTFAQWMTPAEAAVAAAEARRQMQRLRLRGDRCCRPATLPGEERDDDDFDVEEAPEKAPNATTTTAAVKRPLDNSSNLPARLPPKRREHSQPPPSLSSKVAHKVEGSKLPATQVLSEKAAPVVIDLTHDDEDDPNAAVLAVGQGLLSVGAAANRPRHRPRDCWPCRRCTYRNVASCTVCAVCDASRTGGGGDRDNAYTRACRLRIYK